jgi:hypothetical protein
LYLRTVEVLDLDVLIALFHFERGKLSLDESLLMVLNGLLVKLTNKMSLLIFLWIVKYHSRYEHRVYVKVVQEIVMATSIDPHVVYGLSLGFIFKLLKNTHILLVVLSFIVNESHCWKEGYSATFAFN